MVQVDIIWGVVVVSKRYKDTNALEEIYQN